MSVSAHLTPEPERRLWIILESMRHAVEWTETKVGALTVFAAAELAFLKITAASDPVGSLAVAALTVALPLGAFAFAPLRRLPKWLAFLEPAKHKPSLSDNLISPDDLAKYSHGDLIFKLDKYLGGGITATAYYEDIVGQIVDHAHLAARKQRLFRLTCLVVGFAQFCLLGQLIRR
ncbi:MAG: hypothetical protein KGJ84_16990 [Elusimicrobia bacterium]|nr:hypothetical protein [Elusimicrobiota bacterium]